MGQKCNACRDGIHAPVPFSMAFQPIVNVGTGAVFAYEALVRGLANEGAWSVLSQITEDNRYAFDQSCRVQAITLAERLGVPDLDAMLSINFMPGAVYSPAACIQLTLKTADRLGFPKDRLIFEITEGEKVHDVPHLQAIAKEYRKHGFKIAIDDFGEGFANLNLLADLDADIVKLDMALTRNLHQRPKSIHIVRSMASTCQDLGIDLIAEGIETADEMSALQDCGIELMQGYFFARPGFETLPQPVLPGNVRVPMKGSKTHTVRPAFRTLFPMIPDGFAV